MTTKKDILAYVKDEQERLGNPPNYQPIYMLYLFEKANEELVSKEGKPLGWPNTGSAYEAGFYYNLDWAIEAMNENACDIRETCYNAGFILCHFPGLYNCASTYARMYFVWDEEKKGFFQQEEPKIFAHIAY